DAEGKAQHEHEVNAEQAIPEPVAGDTIQALQSVVRGGSGSSAATQCVTAGKTGTATATDPATNAERVSSSWFIGMTPRLVTAVSFSRGVGNEELRGYLNPFFGGTYPAQTFAAF